MIALPFPQDSLQVSSRKSGPAFDARQSPTGAVGSDDSVVRIDPGEGYDSPTEFTAITLHAYDVPGHSLEILQRIGPLDTMWSEMATSTSTDLPTTPRGTHRTINFSTGAPFEDPGVN